ncbi:rRNA (guanine-N1)-methyltransferase [Jannaschia sp. R86511]|uniref:rRNA (guanine-N1)-methyltransferase n=1 Tax=Jannaschia sp. R86511 TaxID=3093853 RepID=UPI0036D2211A
MLRCPVCAGTVDLLAPGVGPRVLACGAGHRFDVARQGHVVLLSGGTKLRADTADMVAARGRVLGSGAFDAVTDALVTALVPVPEGSREGADDGSGRDGAGAGLIVDLGAGPGTYAAALLDALPHHLGLALELSTPALRVAARTHPRLAAVGTDLSRSLPLMDAAVDRDGALVAVFAPLPTADELRRVTRPGARLVVVTPTPDHLAALRSRLDLLDVPAGKPDRLSARLGDAWTPAGRTEIASAVAFTPAQAADVVAMGPNAWHADDTRRAALAALPDHLDDTVAVTVSTFTRT